MSGAKKSLSVRGAQRRSNPSARLLALLLSFLAPAARAHAIHSSLAEADWRAETGQLEIAVRVFADDLEAALSLRANRQISLEATPAKEFDALAEACLRATFTVRSAKAKPAEFAPLTWIGREVKDDEVWLYFSFPLPSGVEGARLAHALLREVHEDQLNSVRVTAHPAPGEKTPSRKTTLTFLRDGEQTVRFAPAAK